MSFKFSIITVVYNRVDSILKCLESVSSQTYQNYEHIIIDGNSTDGTVDVIKSFASDKVIFISESDSGIFDALNKGLKIASGDIVSILNSDDYYCGSNLLNDVIKLFGSSDFDLIFSDVEFFRISNNSEITVRRYSSARFAPERIQHGLMPAHPSMFLKRMHYTRLKGFNTKYEIASDFDFVARLFKDYHIRYLYVPSVFVRMRIGGVSTAGLRSTIKLNLEIITACRSNGYRINYLKILLKYFFKLFEFKFIFKRFKK